MPYILLDAVHVQIKLVSRDGYVALPRGAMGSSAVCACGII